MGKIGKISVIPKEASGEFETLEGSLRAKGYSRIPGTGRSIFPYKETSGKYRTGLDENAAYIKRIVDKHEQELEIHRVKEERKRLENSTQLDLGPTSSYYNHTLNQGVNDTSHVGMVKLKDGDNIYDLDNPLQAITYAWLRVHPTIASSYQAYLRGDYDADTQFYVKEDDIEHQITYKKKVIINKAIAKFDAMSIEKQKKVARMIGLPVTDSTKPEIVYNSIDTFLKKNEVDSGEYKGATPVDLFNRFADMQDEILYVKDLVKQGITYNVIRYTKGGKIEEGGIKVAETLDEFVEFLLDEKNNKDLLAFEDKLRVKKSFV